MNFALNKLIIPKLNDARWLLLLLLFGYGIYAINSPTFTRTPAQFVASLVTCLGLDILILIYKRLPILPVSGLISCFGVLLLTDSPTVWAYVFVGAVTILSKHLIRLGGRHIYNPNNLGVVLALLFFPADVTTEAGRWGGSTLLTLFLASLGIAVVTRAGRLILTASYVGFFFIGVLLRALPYGKPVLMVGAPMTGAAFQLFIFYMISDPATTPKGRRDQLLFGFVLAVVDTYLRMQHLKNAPFFALAILCTVYSVIRYRNGDRPHWVQLRKSAA